MPGIVIASYVVWGLIILVAIAEALRDRDNPIFTAFGYVAAGMFYALVVWCVGWFLLQMGWLIKWLAGFFLLPITHLLGLNPLS